MQAVVVSGYAPATASSRRPQFEGTSLVELLTPGGLRNVAAKEHLFFEGDRKSSVYQVVRGTLAVYRIMSDGRRQIFQSASAGDLVALGLSPVESMSAQATEATVVKCIPLGALVRAFERSPALARDLFEALNANLERMCNHLASLGQDGALARVARFLLNLSDKSERSGADARCLHLGMTRADMGDFLGLTLESVSRAISALKAQGAIELKCATTVLVRRRDLLELATEGNDDV
jgi:CRP/FNR family transcriptional regulator, anaerobic regulatory protein